MALLTVVPASELVIQLLQRLISYLIPPRRLPRIELDDVPASARTMVIVPTLLDSVERVEELIAHLEVQALGNLDPRIHFALLSDFPDAATETQPQDAEILEAVRGGIAALNVKHGNGEAAAGSSCFTGCGSGTPREGLWMGWERKRGKIEEFNRLLRGATDTSFAVSVGDLSILPDVKYCITLDSDTRLPRGVARELIGIIVHPLNRAVFDPRVGRVTEGYGILQPRISVNFMSAAGSLFARLYSGHTGVDPYTTAVSDTYQDLFAEGIFTGKGLYDVDAFIQALEDSVPENALLSHDLFEGLHARVGLVVGRRAGRRLPVERAVARAAPAPVGARRLADPVLAVSVRAVAARPQAQSADRHRPLEDSRQPAPQPGGAGAAGAARSPAGWCCRGSAGSGRAIVVGVAASQLLPVLARLLIGPGRSQSFPVFLTNLRHDASTAVAQILLSLTLLAFHAFDALHAISLTLVRLVVTKRRLLEWETAATTAARAAGLVGSQRPAALRDGDDCQPDHRRRGGSRHADLAPRRAADRDAVSAALGQRAGAGLSAQCPGGSARPPAAQRRAGAPAAHGADDLALLRDLRHRGGRLAAARQFPGRGGHCCPAAWRDARRRPTSG